MKITTLTVAVLLVSLVGCQSHTVRTPESMVSSKDWDELRVLKQRSVELSALSVHFQKKKNEFQLEKIRSEQKEIAAKITEIESRVSAFSDGSKKQFSPNVKSEWREEREKIELRDMSLYTLDKNVELSVSTYEAFQTKVLLTHKFFQNTITPQQVSASKDRPSVAMSMKCNAPFEIKNGLYTKKVKADEVYKFILADKKLTNDSRELLFHSDLKSCDFRFVDTAQPRGQEYGFKLVSETEKLAPLQPILSTTELCSLKKDTGKFFDNTDFVHYGCPSKYESIEMLPEPIDSLHARVEALLGTKLPEDFVKNGNPYAELDFSKAPKFDAILVSYLVYRADFYGTLMTRLLAYHADKGALVRVIASEVITLGKDEDMYEKMMAQHPNMKFILYKFDTSQQGGAWISEFHRVNHVKLFIGYSKDDPQASFVIVGGKNIHDGFVFKTPVDVAKFPEMVNYATGDDSWAYWRDFEMVIRGQDFVQSLVRDYMNFYHINKANMVMKISSVTVAKDAAPELEEETMRHYVSIPFKDEPNLNLFYARMLDTAQKKILISTPYFRPVKEIADALERAIKRGVEITLLTRLDLEGDTADFILGAVNKDGVNQYYKKIKVLEYTEPKVILHSKLLMIDDEVTFVSSVNLNKRSFYHDMENGVVVKDAKFTRKMEDLYALYSTISKPLTEEQKIIFWKKWIIKIFDKVL